MEAKLGSLSDYNSYDAYHQDLNLTFHNGVSDTSAHYWCLNLVLGRVTGVEGWCISSFITLSKLLLKKLALFVAINLQLTQSKNTMQNTIKGQSQNKVLYEASHANSFMLRISMILIWIEKHVLNCQQLWGQQILPLLWMFTQNGLIKLHIIYQKINSPQIMQMMDQWSNHNKVVGAV